MNSLFKITAKIGTQFSFAWTSPNFSYDFRQILLANVILVVNKNKSRSYAHR